MKKQLLIISMMCSVMALRAADGVGAGGLGLPDVIGTLQPGDDLKVARLDNFLCGKSRGGIDDYHELAIRCVGAEDGSRNFYMGRYCLEIIKGIEAESRFRQTEVAIQNRRLTLAGAFMVAWIVGREVVPRVRAYYVQRGASR